MKSFSDLLRTYLYYTLYFTVVQSYCLLVVLCSPTLPLIISYYSLSNIQTWNNHKQQVCSHKDLISDFFILFVMSSEKAVVEEADDAFREFDQCVLQPIFNRCSSWNCATVDLSISSKCTMRYYSSWFVSFVTYRVFFGLFTKRNQNNDNYQEAIYLQARNVFLLCIFQVQRIKSFYDSLIGKKLLLPEGDKILEVLCCKWEEMNSISNVLGTVLLYVVSSAFLFTYFLG